MENTASNTILLVDDETVNLMFLTNILSPEYTVYIAQDGQSAIRKAEEVSPDIILLDIIMPGMNGYEVLSVLRDKHETRDIPVIFITGLNSSKDEEKGLESDAVDYISKPFSVGIVKLRVRNQIRIINQMREINRLSVTDLLTGISNRRGFEHQMRREWGRAIREKLPISILMIDVDHFKVFNDTYGHQQGDAVLQEVAIAISRCVTRTTDFAARWGGEEFIVMLPNTEIKGALIVAENIRENIEQIPVYLPDGTTAQVTVSIGVGTTTPEPGDMNEKLISEADKALYTAKESGRNNVCH